MSRHRWGALLLVVVDLVLIAASNISTPVAFSSAFLAVIGGVLIVNGDG